MVSLLSPLHLRLQDNFLLYVLCFLTLLLPYLSQFVTICHFILPLATMYSMTKTLSALRHKQGCYE